MPKDKAPCPSLLSSQPLPTCLPEAGPSSASASGALRRGGGLAPCQLAFGGARSPQAGKCRGMGKFGGGGGEGERPLQPLCSSTRHPVARGSKGTETPAISPHPSASRPAPVTIEVLNQFLRLGQGTWATPFPPFSSLTSSVLDFFPHSVHVRVCTSTHRHRHTQECKLHDSMYFLPVLFTVVSLVLRIVLSA